jgi:hypothetical protein
MVDAFHAVLFMEQKLTNSGPFMESTSKHSIYTPSRAPPASGYAVPTALGAPSAHRGCPAGAARSVADIGHIRIERASMQHHDRNTGDYRA